MADCIAMTPNDWAMAVETGISFAPPPSPDIELGLLQHLTAAAYARPDMRLDDGRYSRQDRFWAGTMVLDTSLDLSFGKLYHLDTAAVCIGYVGAVIDDLIIPNDLAFSPDGRTAYLSDSHASHQMIWVFDYNIDIGALYGRRVFADMDAHPGRPDGVAMGTDGCYWIYGNDAGFVHRFTPDGRLGRNIAIPTSKPTIYVFGGPGLDTLFVTSICIGDDPFSGVILVVHLGVTRLPGPILHP